jgi:hypothetical protein
MNIFSPISLFTNHECRVCSCVILFFGHCHNNRHGGKLLLDRSIVASLSCRADIGKYIADAARLSKEIAEHEADISTWTGDSKAATTVRGMEKSTYDTTHKDYSESIDALGRAIEVMKKQAFDRNQASSLVQLSALKELNLFPKEAKRQIDAFLSEDPAEGLAVSAPAAEGYEFQSSGIVDMLEKLNDKFIAERTDLEKEEANAKHAFEMLIQDLTAQIDQANNDKTSKSESKATTLQNKPPPKATFRTQPQHVMPTRST